MRHPASPARQRELRDGEEKDEGGCEEAAVIIEPDSYKRQAAAARSASGAATGVRPVGRYSTATHSSRARWVDGPTPQERHAVERRARGRVCDADGKWRTPFVPLPRVAAAMRARWDEQKHGAAAPLERLIFELSAVVGTCYQMRELWKRYCADLGKGRDPRAHSKETVVEFFRLNLGPLDGRICPHAAAAAGGLSGGLA